MAFFIPWGLVDFQCVLPPSQWLSTRDQISSLDTLSSWSGAWWAVLPQDSMDWLTLLIRPTLRPIYRGEHGHAAEAVMGLHKNKHSWCMPQDTECCDFQTLLLEVPPVPHSACSGSVGPMSHPSLVPLSDQSMLRGMNGVDGIRKILPWGVKVWQFV